MSKRQWLCLLGVWIMVFLFLGLPSTWHKVIALVSGLLIIAIAYNLPSEMKKDSNGVASNSSSSFVESENKSV